MNHGVVSLDVLEYWYGAARVVRRCESIYPTAIETLSSNCADAVTVEAGNADLDPVMLAHGSSHLAQLAESGAAAYDGRVLSFVGVVDGEVRARPSTYFAMLATCDAIRAEFEGHPVVVHDPYAALRSLRLRSRAHELAEDPTVSGRGRAAALGVSVVVSMPGRLGRFFLVGRRQTHVATDPGVWHVAPSGMLEESRERVLATTVSRELREELGVSIAVDEVEERAVVLGLAHDLLRLRPDICVRLDLAVDDLRDSSVSLSTEEFAGAERVELSAGGINNFWAHHPPRAITPACAGAIALVERTIVQDA